MSWDKWIRVIVFVLVIGSLIAVVDVITNPFRQTARIIEKTIDADNVIYNYEWFKKTNQDIKSLDSKIAITKAAVELFKKEAGPRDGWHRADIEESFRLNSVYMGLKQQRNDVAAEYNARSEMANKEIFKTGELPDFFEMIDD